MALESDIVVTAAPAASGIQEHHSYVDWAAVIGGILLLFVHR